MCKKFLLALGVASLPCLAIAQMPQMPPGMDIAAMQRMYEKGQTEKPSEADAKLTCEELEKEMGRFMQDVQPEAEAVGKAGKDADEYQRQVAAQQQARAPAESAAIMAAAAGDSAGVPGAGRALEAQHKAKAAEGMARQPQSNAVMGELLNKSAGLAQAQPEDRMVRMMQLQRLHEDKRCPPPEFMEDQ
jgi:hypothetical protein